MLKGLAGNTRAEGWLLWLCQGRPARDGLESTIISQELRENPVGEGSRDSREDGEQQEQGVHAC